VLTQPIRHKSEHFESGSTSLGTRDPRFESALPPQLAANGGINMPRHEVWRLASRHYAYTPVALRGRADRVPGAMTVLRRE